MALMALTQIHQMRCAVLLSGKYTSYWCCRLQRTHMDADSVSMADPPLLWTIYLLATFLSPCKTVTGRQDQNSDINVLSPSALCHMVRVPFSFKIMVCNTCCMLYPLCEHYTTSAQHMVDARLRQSVSHTQLLPEKTGFVAPGEWSQVCVYPGLNHQAFVLKLKTKH